MQKIDAFLDKYSLTIVIIIHSVGVIGLLSPLKSVVAALTPINLLISCLLLLYKQESKTSSFYTFCLIILMTGFTIEAVGVNTGFPFGEYSYGNVLGPKIIGTPLVIGVNWLLLIIAIGSYVNSLSINVWKKVVLSAALMVILDVLIEPVAISLNFWSWDTTSVPFQNYLGWFLISVVMFSAYFLLPLSRENKLGKLLFIIQLLFFSLLNISL
ncbi:MAG: carotenoid biosynthesis protein [Cyclobacteriaceae bacterium]